MASFFAAFTLAMFIPIVVGLPLALRLGPLRGPRVLGLAAAYGLAVVLITVRAVHMLVPIDDAATCTGLLWLAIAGVAWLDTRTRHAASALFIGHWKILASIAIAIVTMATAINVPILFSDALQFEGTSNADSFTFTSSARYMLEHAFHGDADFSPEHPVYAISRSYFGDGATQPRPAAEGYLAWLSAALGQDPMRLYNATQTAGWGLAVLSIMGFWPTVVTNVSRTRRVLAMVFTVTCPTVLLVALNSNFANIFHLPVATAYVLLSRHENSTKTFIASVVLLACLLGGYPELIPFAGICRGVALIVHAMKLGSWRWAARECSLRAWEAAAACLLVPWAALHAWTVLTTSMTLSGGAEALRGNIHAGLPLFIASLAAWRWSRRGQHDGDARLDHIIAAICTTFALAQCWVIYRGFDYGGFKLSEYFSTMLAGVLVAATFRIGANRRSAYQGMLFALAAFMLYQSTYRLMKSWRIAEYRKVTADLLHAAAFADSLPQGTLIAMGATPTFFYYGMWANYLTRARLIYDVSLKDTAGYLSPYVRLADKTPLTSAKIKLSIDSPGGRRAKLPCDTQSFGSVHIGRCE